MVMLTFDDVVIIPQYSEIRSRKECDTVSQFGKFKLQIPIIASPMETVTGPEMCNRMQDLGCLGIMHRFMSIKEQVLAINQIKWGPRAAAVGVNDYKRIDALMEDCELEVIDIDVAHGHHKKVQETIAYIKNNYPECHIMAGAIGTRQAARDLAIWGADSIRVGVGGGSLCETRIRTGVGVPMISSLKQARLGVLGAGLDANGVSLVADGGIRYPGDMAKALAVGAHAVILGSLLAGTKETPQPISKRGSWPNEVLYKRYAGAASLEAKSNDGQISTVTGDIKYVEGNSKIIPYKGKAKRIVMDMREGLQSAMSYVGAKTVEEFKQRANIERVSPASVIEARPHLLEEK